MGKTKIAVALGVSAWLIAACGGGETPGAASEQADRASAATAGAVSSKYRVALAQGGERNTLDKRLRGARGPVEVWISLEQNSVAAERVALAEAAGLGAADDGAAKRSPQLKQGAAAHLKRVHEAQGALVQKLSSVGGKELARVQSAHNAVAVRVDASQLSQLAAMPGVAKVRPVLHYQLALAETVPYVGGTAVQNSGRDGSGVTVAVLDSGIDYTHRNLGGEGTAVAYAAAWGTAPADPKNTTLDGLFPDGQGDRRL